jgi:hypothetical protein
MAIRECAGGHIHKGQQFPHRAGPIFFLFLFSSFDALLCYAELFLKSNRMATFFHPPAPNPFFATREIYCRDCLRSLVRTTLFVANDCEIRLLSPFAKNHAVLQQDDPFMWCVEGRSVWV